jgi:hypothetical protein
MSNKKQIELKTKLPGRQKNIEEKEIKSSKTSEKLGLKKDTKYYPKSYRWRSSDIEMIEMLVDKVNRTSNRKLDATKIIRGALVIASKSKTEKLLNAIVQAEMNSIL